MATSSQLTFGKSLLVAQVAGASASFATSKKTITLFFATGPSYGKLTLFLNDKRTMVIDQYSGRAGKRALTISKSFVIKKITFVALGQKSKKSRSSQVNIDALSFSSKTCTKKCLVNPAPLNPL